MTSLTCLERTFIIHIFGEMLGETVHLYCTYISTIDRTKAIPFCRWKSPPPPPRKLTPQSPPFSLSKWKFHLYKYIQGSILGPILFLCYINDFYSATALFSVLFADDTICLGNGKNLNDLTAFVNAELKKIANWFRSNKMAVNTSKTKFIVFRTRVV